ncbi:MAG: acylneuraminate cytidylyltransferase family protein [Gammaproteobacteria bacterium]|nr:acylneuraminate cytidylyltransferase family protein [Gammaproteobacteria bacterium]
MNTNAIVCIIPARSGSKGIPGKNLVDINGKPLLAWTIDAAIKSEVFDRIIVSTDNDEIADTARIYGAEVPFNRPAHLADDQVHSVHVVLHALDWLKKNEEYSPDGIMMLLPTSPLRRASDIRGAVEMFKLRQAPAVIGVVDLGKYMTNLRYLDEEHLERVAPMEDPNAQRQGLKKLYSVNGAIFMTKPDNLRKSGTFHLEGSLGYVMNVINSIDINSLEDLQLAKDLSKVLDHWNCDNKPNK